MLKPADIDSLFINLGEVLTPLEVANAVRASDSFVCDLINGGELPCFLVGSHFRVLKPDVVADFKSTVAATAREDTPRR
jgi:excisionase family DNA binding protein